jgi:asparagine synthase (glutamine-hydrolysing)
MCSIVGSFKLQPSATVDLSFFDNAFDLMRHRGPDFEKYKIIDDICTLGHQRLAIIDVGKGSNQPMDSLSNHIVFNGEIYNYIELRDILIRNKIIFNTESDTEVLLKGLASEGVEFLNKLNGMFAFSYYSSLTKEMLLVRDRFGVKPLHYTIKKGVLYFSSEIKPLIKIKSNAKENYKIYDSFMQDLATDYDESTFIDGIYQVPKGHFLSVKDGKYELVKWYHGVDFEFDSTIFSNYNDTVDFVEELLTDAIDKRLRADVPVCITLSGGLDSSVIYTLIKDNLKRHIQPYTYTHPGSPTDEFYKVSKLVEKYNDFVCCVSADTSISVRDLEESLYFLEFPTWNPSSVAYMDMYKSIAKGGYKVVIEGHASDEILGGYSYVIRSAVFEYIKSFDFKKAKEVIDVLNATNNKNIANKITIPRLIGAYIRNMLKGEKYNKSFQSGIDRLFDYKILPIVLRTFDRLTMRSSVESRSPFMDYRIVEVMKALPIEYKISKIGNKAILREILKKHGKEVIYKDQAKMGFSANLPEMFNSSDFRTLFKESLLNSPYERRYSSIFKQAKKISNQEVIGWAESGTLWKAASLSMINKMYRLNE